MSEDKFILKNWTDKARQFLDDLEKYNNEKDLVNKPNLINNLADEIIYIMQIIKSN